MYTTTKITVCPFAAALMSPNIMTNGIRVERLMATRVGPPCEGSEKTQPRTLSLVKSSSARLRHIMLHTYVPFHEITPNKYPATERKDVRHQKEPTSYDAFKNEINKSYQMNFY
ncbi:hypothetical protein TNCV_2502981 [Trichonephila clavipes]|nr:hypothetical protein TNCV_2502981 [Trichonephila clavipes]